MEIIVLTGESNNGKTSSLVLAYEKFITISGGTGTEFKHIGAVNQRDFTDIVPYQGKKIAFFTMGDVGEDGEEEGAIAAINDCNKMGVNIYVCACNTEAKQIKNHITKHYKPIEIQKTIFSNPIMSMWDANLYDSFRILLEIKKLLTK
jgi:predicted peroxiredoxin